MTQVKKGDVCFVDNGTRNTRLPGQPRLLGDHAFMIAMDGELRKDAETVHLTWGGIEMWPIEHQGGRPDYLFRCPDAALAAKAADYAMAFAKHSRNHHYDQARSKAVMHDLLSNGALPYDFDALRRSLKWGRKAEAVSALSERKGLSCCAFIVACFQAAAFSSPNIEKVKLDKAWEKIELLRVDKSDFRSTTAASVSNPNYREAANPGAKALDARAQVLACVKSGNESDDAFLERVLTWPMVVDARFLHTDGLIRRLQDSKSTWTQVTRHQVAWPWG